MWIVCAIVTVAELRAAEPSDPGSGSDHWAFRPLNQHQPPHVQASDWPLSSIDRFILAKLEAEHLRPAADADGHALVRRIYFQLIGLPPTSSQVAEFLNDERSDALERIVDQLLNSPHFGERWGRHWLDLARYADSNGLDENFLFREAWRYRNWVIAAINSDTPFDRFVLEQIAGDLLPYDSIEQRDRQRIAAGFLVVGPKVLLGVEPKKQRMEVADEQLDTIGRAVLGQTLGCARCHDHNFDPFPTADYYAMAGILTSTEVMEKRYMNNLQRTMERLVGLGLEGEAADDAYEEYWLEHPQLKKQAEQAKAALERLEKGDVDNTEGLAKEAADASVAIEARIAVQKALVEELASKLADTPTIPPRAMIPCDVQSPADEHIRIAGEYDRLGDQVPRGFLSVLNDSAIEIPQGQSGRIELGRWLTDTDDGAGRLAARVLANRVWHHLIGRGIVRTVDNFGHAGEAPSHPELLDHLACELIHAKWSIKKLVRKIVLSRTFAMSSSHNAAGHSIDPDNRLLWRAHRRRLDPESLRDAVLAAAGELDTKPMESTVWYLQDQATGVGVGVRRRTDFPCRSVYLPVIRNDLPELFEVFDFADAQCTTGARPKTTVPSQGLFMLNDEVIMDAAAAVARRVTASPVSSDTDKIGMMFELVLNRGPTEDERGALLGFLQQTEQGLAESSGGEGRAGENWEAEASSRAWSIACHALFATSRFQFLD